MSTDTKKLFTPFHIKQHTFKNRIGVAPMTRMSSGEDSIPRMDVLEFLIHRAENGSSIVYTEAIVTDYESAQGYPGQSRITTQQQIDAWTPVVKKIQKAGAVAIMQLFHCGRMAWNSVNPAHRVIAPSPVSPSQDNPLTEEKYPIPEEMSPFDIEHVINGFVESARGAVAAGFDGIEIHGAHGYLINQFLSTYSNKRTDSFSGSMDNRFRFARKIIQAVKGVVPEDRLLFFRISNWGVADMEVPLFNSAEEWLECIQLLSQEDLDAISVSTYDFQEPAFSTGKNMGQLTREATNLPLLICGKIHDRKSADDALADADIVLSGKSMLLNPHFVQDLKEGKEMAPFASDEANIAYTEEILP